jgi:hypothetical protein
MKLLIESWHTHLKENISEDQKQQTLRILKNWFGYEGVPEEVFQKVPIFRDTFIKKRIGSGTAATAFELGNGNVLRLYSNNRYMGHRSIEEEDRQYEKVMSRTFGGSSKKGDIVVYAHGIIEIESDIDDEPERKVGWVEMNKVLTLPDYYRYMDVPPYVWEDKRESFDNLVYDIKSFLSDFSLTENEDEWEAIEQFENSFHFNKYRYEHITKKELEIFIAGIFKHYKMNNWDSSLGDIHFDNVGFLSLYDQTLVVFDY